MTLSCATSPGNSGPGSDGNEGVLRIPQSSSITGTWPTDCLMSYPEYLLVETSYPSAEKQLVYSTAKYTELNVKTVLFQTIQFSISIHLNIKTFLFQATQFSISTQFCFIWPIDQGATAPGHSGPGSDGSTETSPSDCLMSYLQHSLGWSLPPSTKKRPVYSTVLSPGQYMTFKWIACR